MANNFPSDRFRSFGGRPSASAGPTEDLIHVFGSGAPSGATHNGITLASGQQAVYWRTNASTVDTLCYFTVDGGTTWTAVQTDGVLSATGTIAAASVATLNATPVELVAAPGAGYYIEVQRILWFLDFATTQYDAAASGDTLVAKYTNGSGAAVVSTVAGDTFGGASADALAVAVAAAVVPVANAAVVAHINTGEWYSAAGDSPVKYRVDYLIRATDPTA